MEPNNIKKLPKAHICELCLLHDPMVKDYSEDIELQKSIKDYVQKSTGDRVNIEEIAKLCDSCYYMVNDIANQKN
jgi:hypothetical protein